MNVFIITRDGLISEVLVNDPNITVDVIDSSFHDEPRFPLEWEGATWEVDPADPVVADPQRCRELMEALIKQGRRDRREFPGRG